VFASVASAYAIFLFIAAGLGFQLLSCLLYAPAALLFGVALYRLLTGVIIV
jgi:arginine:ornithine antiporter/lysine permease